MFYSLLPVFLVSGMSWVLYKYLLKECINEYFILFTKEILQVTIISFMVLRFIYRSLICIYVHLYLTLFIVDQFSQHAILNKFLFSYWLMMLCLFPSKLASPSFTKILMHHRLLYNDFRTS